MKVILASTKRATTGGEEALLLSAALGFCAAVARGSRRFMRDPSFLSVGSPEQKARTAAATRPGVSRRANAAATGRKHLQQVTGPANMRNAPGELAHNVLIPSHLVVFSTHFLSRVQLSSFFPVLTWLKQPQHIIGISTVR